MEFEAFPKISRYSRGIVVTEKLDGTNAQVCIDDDFITIRFGSRTKWITPENDNYGFARWGTENKEELLKLGPGRHFGEWWGGGIQRQYGLIEKRFSLFNVGRWTNNPLPACCGLVPVLYSGPMSDEAIKECLERLRIGGSVAAPGFMDPEGIIVYHSASGILFKKTLQKDEVPKGVVSVSG